MKKIVLSIGFALTMFFSVTNLNAQHVFALTNTNMFYWFDVSNPAMMSTPTAIIGVASNYEIVGMDVRPATGEVYLLAHNNTTQMAQLYVLDTATKNVTPIGMGISNLMLSGKVGFDFNPTVDRIRVTSSDEHDYRLHPVTGGLVATDGAISYGGADVNAGINPNIGTSAYTNSYIGATSTTLYNYDDSLNVLTIQNPPNNGVQNTVGSSGIMVNWADATSDMDIYFNPNTMQNMAYFTANTGSSMNDSVYSINLSTGMATSIAALNMAIKDIAVMIDRTAPMPMGNWVYGLTSTSNIIRFYSQNPQHIIGAVPVSGLTAGQTLLAMDVRPTDLKLYGLGYNATSNVARVYTINPLTGAAIPVTVDSIMNIDLTGDVSVDFNPVVDRLRVVTSKGKNYRINQLTGLLAATDSTLSYKTGDVNFGAKPTVSSVAYTNSKVGTTTTLLYTYDDSLNVLLTQNPPNEGLLNTVGVSGVMVNPMDKTTDMDIYFNHSNQMNEAYFIANTMGSNDRLYSLSLSSGTVTPIGFIGMGISVKDIAIQLDSTPVTQPTGLHKYNEMNGVNINAYPNPISDKLTVQFELAQKSTVKAEMIDITGKVVMSSIAIDTVIGNNVAHFDTSLLQNGVYFVRLQINGIATVVKVIK